MPKVVIDPGHGGADSGAVGNGLQEKMFTLQFSLKVNHLLERSGVDVLLTRTTDQALGEIPNGDLAARYHFANRNHADLFVSFHLNSNSGTPASGFESYVYSGQYPDKARTERAREPIHRHMNHVAAKFGLVNRGLKEADFAVLRETQMPACLVEIAFINNPRDAAVLQDPRFVNEMAGAAARGICEAVGVHFVPPGPPPVHEGRQLTLEQAVSVLHTAGVINSADYWLQAALPGSTAKGEYVGQLIQNMARKIQGH